MGSASRRTVGRHLVAILIAVGFAAGGLWILAPWESPPSAGAPDLAGTPSGSSGGGDSAPSESSRVEPAARPSSEARLPPARGTAWWRVRVVDAATGTPLADARVAAEGAEPQRTDGDGVVVLRRDRAGRLEVRLWAEGYMERRVVLPPFVETVVPLSRRASLRVRVEDASSGMPLRGAEVTLLAPGVRRARSLGTTGEDGLLEVPAEAGWCSLTCSAPGYFPRTLEVRLPFPGVLPVPLGSLPSFEVRVRSDGGGAVEDLSFRDAFDPDRPLRARLVRGEAEARLWRVFARPAHVIGVSAAGFAERWITLPDDPGSTLEVSLAPEARLVVVGRWPDGRPVRGRLSFSFPAASTRVSEQVELDEGGRAVLERLSPEVRLQLALVGQDGTRLALREIVVGEAVAAGGVVELVAAPSTESVLDLVVLSQDDGSPIAGAAVRAQGEGRRETVWTDGEGRARIRVPEGGSVAVEHPDFCVVVVEAGEATASVRRVALPRGGAIEGRVIDDLGRPVPYARVEVDAAAGERRTRSVFADAGGRFRIQGICAPEVVLQAFAPGVAVTTLTGVRCRVGEPVTLRVTRFGWVEVRWRSATAPPEWRVQISDPHSPYAGFLARSVAVPAGARSVRLAVPLGVRCLRVVPKGGVERFVSVEPDPERLSVVSVDPSPPVRVEFVTPNGGVARASGRASRIDVVPAGCGAVFHGVVELDGEGRGAIELAPGRYRFELRGRDGSVLAAREETVTGPVTLSFAPP